MQIDNETGKDILFYDLKEDDKEITKKQAFKGDTLVLDLENYDGNSVYTVEVYGVDKNIKASAKLYQVQANLTGDTSTNVPMANGVVSEAEKSRTYEASESCVVNDVDYDLNGNGNVSVGYYDSKSSSGYSVDYVKHDSAKTAIFIRPEFSLPMILEMYLVLKILHITEHILIRHLKPSAIHLPMKMVRVL